MFSQNDNLDSFCVFLHYLHLLRSAIEIVFFFILLLIFDIVIFLLHWRLTIVFLQEENQNGVIYDEQMLLNLVLLLTYLYFYRYMIYHKLIKTNFPSTFALRYRGVWMWGGKEIHHLLLKKNHFQYVTFFDWFLTQ